jgi:hypothetical protein
MRKANEEITYAVLHKQKVSYNINERKASVVVLYETVQNMKETVSHSTNH